MPAVLAANPSLGAVIPKPKLRVSTNGTGITAIVGDRFVSGRSTSWTRRRTAAARDTDREPRAVSGASGLAADSPVELIGWGAGVDAVWVATQVRHALTGDGYRTRPDIEVVTVQWERTAAQQLPEAPFGVPAVTNRQPPDVSHVVERVAAEHPAELREARDTSAFVDLAVPALRAADGRRWEHRRDAGGWNFDKERGLLHVRGHAR